MDGRVDGGLALSRAFGDYEYKMRSDLPPFRQKVSALPDVRIVKRLPGIDAFLLLACDGLWDVMQNQPAMIEVYVRCTGRCAIAPIAFLARTLIG